MSTCLGESCSFGLLCVSFVNFCRLVCECAYFPIGFKGGIWMQGFDSISFLSLHFYLSIYHALIEDLRCKEKQRSLFDLLTK